MIHNNNSFDKINRTGRRGPVFVGGRISLEGSAAHVLHNSYFTRKTI
ncbi:hypothetical protein HMPREF3293_02578 [Christensenella minuta]|uniref:Uncharacterized protein n=1 Tax=Christensenella minuta TaxID=626937 RepID=A0A136Q1E2_9FIRM|nr:hypothetical protein HMPREF3293_02578 [Christensenella minuta]